MTYKPPFTLTSDIVSLVADIAEKIGRLSAKPDFDMSLRLRRINRIRTITGPLKVIRSLKPRSPPFWMARWCWHRRVKFRKRAMP